MLGDIIQDQVSYLFPGGSADGAAIPRGHRGASRDTAALRHARRSEAGHLQGHRRRDARSVRAEPTGSAER
jgi:hypothetical protein